ncbi:flagellar export chaperone FliS [Frigoribacterium sp. ACAM 257]|uniref:flagellar export chaperone FliS n=1 Tax=Frigoribacterium sp. ACAM 257 TaxID=2508998 RepID=UPI0011BA0DDD|nr:flagellar export chaperone FliS [Frigoribacterium sp. ACAM 257]TWX38560.1 flagellar export chaperone FliS [Frigoribacterium sp. ACAM 257]
MDATSFAAFAASPPTAVVQRQRSHFAEQAVLSATPVQLVTMLYDRLLLDLARAEKAQVGQEWAIASEQLLHAQAIIAELTSSLRVDVWDGGEGLLALYGYTSTALVNANVHRDVALTREVTGLLEPLRQAWHEAATSLGGGAAGGAGAAGAAGAAGVAVPASPTASQPGAGSPLPAGVAAFGAATSGYGATNASSTSLGGELGVA